MTFIRRWPWPNGLIEAPRAWDEGLRVHLEQDADHVWDWNADTLSLEEVRDDHLRAVNGGEEDRYIERLIRTSYRIAEDTTRRAHLPQTFRLVLSGFPWGWIYLPKPPLLEVLSFTYIDGDGDEQEFVVSPADFEIVAPTGPHAKQGYIRPLQDASWPTARTQPNAVAVTYRAGYPTVDGVVQVPEDIDHARLLIIGELYKQRSESVHTSQSPALIRARDLLLQYRAY